MDRGALVTDPDRPIPGSAARVIAERVRRRVAREPVAYILGRKGFRHIELAVDNRVLIPRPETELLVEVALELPAGARVHDVGTGSGAVALALRDERPDLIVSASDASPGAVEVARANAARLGLELEVAVTAGLPAGVFDLVVANLPYVAEGEMCALAPEIQRYEPREALVCGARRTRRDPGADRPGARAALGWRSSTRPTRARRCARCLRAGPPGATSPGTSA